MQKRNHLELVNFARRRLLLAYPFFSALAYKAEIVNAPAEVTTAATDGRYMFWNEKWTLDTYAQPQGLEKLMGTVAHEALHVGFCHHTRIGDRDPILWNIATDLAINQILVDCGLTLPEGALLDSKYKGWTAENIYNDLKKKINKLPKAQTWGQVMKATGPNGQPLTAKEIAAIQAEAQATLTAALAAAKARGNLPGSLAGVLDEIPSQAIDWKTALINIWGGPGNDDYSFKKFSHFGMTMGIALPSLCIGGPGHIVIALDTSGSVSNDELAKALGELNSLLLTNPPESLTVIQCDYEIQSVEDWPPGTPSPQIKILGRGGTSFSPVLTAIQERGIRCQQLIFFTDGDGDNPPPPDFPTLWVSTTGRCSATFGRTVHLKD